MPLNRAIVAGLLAAACTVNTGGPPLKGAGGGAVQVGEDRTVRLDETKVPVLEACEAGKYVRRSEDGTGWECAGEVTWATLADKPTEFAPAAHAHPVAQVTGFNAAAVAARGPAGDDQPLNHGAYTDADALAAMDLKDDDNPLHHDRTTGEDAVAAMGARENTNPLHHHRYTDAEAGAAAAAALDWGDVTGAPAQFPPATHPHTAAHFTGFDGAAVSAMGTRSNTNALNHDRYMDAEAVNAVADAGLPFASIAPSITPTTAWPGTIARLTGAGRTVSVTASGTAAENGTALLTALQNIPSPREAANPYLIKLGPGVYSVGATPVQMKEYVDIEGSGEQATRITGTGEQVTTGQVTRGTVMGANNAELRFVTVENTGGQSHAVAVYDDGASPRLTHVTAMASGGNTNNIGIENSAASSPLITNVTARASGANAIGIRNRSSSNAQMINVVATGNGAGDTYGVVNLSSSPAMTNVEATGSGTQSALSVGVSNSGGSSPKMSFVIATGTGASTADGVRNEASSPVISYSHLKGDQAGIRNYGSMVTVRNSVVSGSWGVSNDSSGQGNSTFKMDSSVSIGNLAGAGSQDGSIIRIGRSRLFANAAAVSEGGDSICAGVVGIKHTFFPGPSCPSSN